MASKIVNTKLVHFPYKVKLRLLPNSRSFVANQKARNAIVGAENLLNKYRNRNRNRNLKVRLWFIIGIYY